MMTGGVALPFELRTAVRREMASRPCFVEPPPRLITLPCASCGIFVRVRAARRRVLSKHDIRGMPVVDEDGKVLGLVSCKEVRVCARQLFLSLDYNKRCCSFWFVVRMHRMKRTCETQRPLPSVIFSVLPTFSLHMCRRRWRRRSSWGGSTSSSRAG